MKKSARRTVTEPVEKAESSTLAYYAKYAELSSSKKKRSKKRKIVEQVVVRAKTNGMTMRKTVSGMADMY